MKRASKGLAVCLFLALLCSCERAQEKEEIYVTLEPIAERVIINQSLQLTAAVHNSTNGSVTWGLYGAGCTGTACGTISDTGLYNAPAIVPNPAEVTVTATSAEDPSKSANATITIVADINLWAWISGSSEVNQPASHGTKGLSSPTNIPGARNGAASWTDPQGKLWLFGGRFGGGGGTYNDLWMYDPATNEWTWVSGSDVAYQQGSYGTKGIGSPSNVPGARANSATWIDAQGKFWLLGGEGLGSTSTVGSLNDLWTYDPATSDWTWVSGGDTVGQPGVYGTQGSPAPSNVPGGRSGAVCWLDAGGQLWLFGGRGRDSVGFGDYWLNDLWRFDPATLEWTWISGSLFAEEEGSYGTQGVADPSNVPGARSGAISWTDPQGRLWLFGGIGYAAAGSYGFLNDVWTYDPAISQWTWVSGADVPDQAGNYGTRGTAAPSNIPGAREEAVCWNDAAGKLWLFGGVYVDSLSNAQRHNDLWERDPITLQWTWVAGSDATNQIGTYGTRGIVGLSNTPGARFDGVSWIDLAGNLWLFGGGGFASTGTDGNLNDLWKYKR